MNILGIIMMQVITMFQPEAIFETGSGGSLATVETSRGETSIRVRFPSEAALLWDVTPTAYLSDETDVHHPLLRSEAFGNDWLLVFEALPPTTRVFDLVADNAHSSMKTQKSTIPSIELSTTTASRKCLATIAYTPSPRHDYHSYATMSCGNGS